MPQQPEEWKMWLYFVIRIYITYSYIIFWQLEYRKTRCYSSFETTAISPLVSTPLLERPVLSTLIHVCFRTGRTPAPRCVPRNTSRLRVPADTRGSSSCRDSAAGSGCVTAQLQVSVPLSVSASRCDWRSASQSWCRTPYHIIYIISLLAFNKSSPNHRM
jgi:hypothetical protein